jgi:transporter family-2 protein
MMVLFAILSGVTVVVGRMLNAQACGYVGLRRSTFNNYLVGLLVSLAAMAAAGEGLGWPAGPGGPFIYLGGAMGVGVVMISSHIALKISVLRMTLVAFVCQMAAALALDAWLSGEFSARRAVGGALVLAGLLVQGVGGGGAPAEKCE